MFSKSADKRQTNEFSTSSPPKTADVPSIIASDLRVAGDLICNGAVEIEGEVDGNVTCTYVTIRRTGMIKGNVVADVIQVDGEINGTVQGKNVSISESGKVVGMIVYETLAVRDGGYIEGQCTNSERFKNGQMQAINQIDNNQLHNVLSTLNGSVRDVFTSHDMEDMSEVSRMEEHELTKHKKEFAA